MNWIVSYRLVHQGFKQWWMLTDKLGRTYEGITQQECFLKWIDPFRQ